MLGTHIIGDALIDLLLERCMHAGPLCMQSRYTADKTLICLHKTETDVD